MVRRLLADESASLAANLLCVSAPELNPAGFRSREPRCRRPRGLNKPRLVRSTRHLCGGLFMPFERREIKPGQLTTLS